MDEGMLKLVERVFESVVDIIADVEVEVETRLDAAELLLEYAFDRPRKEEKQS